MAMKNDWIKTVEVLWKVEKRKLLKLTSLDS